MVRRSVARNLAYLRNNILSDLTVDLGCTLNPPAVSLTEIDLTGSDLQRCWELATAALAGATEGSERGGGNQTTGDRRYGAPPC